MNRFLVPRFVGLALVAGWVVCALWVVGGQMRESDQASVLTGAVELARGEAGWVGNESYNYDKQYLSYWIVAGALKATGGGGGEATIDGVVRVANHTAVLLFALGLLSVVLVQREWRWGKVLLLGCVLLSPVVAFTGVLLSPNLISGAFVLLLVAVLGRGEERGRWVLAGLLAFAATAARQDAILLMPVLVVLAPEDGTWRRLVRSWRVWAMAGGCLLAMVLGRLLDSEPTSLPPPFFVAPTFVVYLAGGLGAVLLLVLVFAGQLLGRRTCEGVLLGGALLVPLVFYGCLLYTPRHLFVVALAVMATVLLPRGGVLWQALVVKRWGRVVVWVAVVGTLVPWVVGVRMSDRTRGRLVVQEATLYPSADGFWPMGSYGVFLGRLARAAEEPIDHNQELWAAWASVEGEELPEGKGAVVSSGLGSFGRFALMWHGREVTADVASADYVLFDDRTISKRELSVDRSEYGGRERAGGLLTEGRIEVVGRAEGRSVLLWTPEGVAGVVDDWVSLRMALAESYGGNDFRLGFWEEAEWKGRDWRSHRIYLASRSREGLEEVSRSLGGASETVELRSDYDARPWQVRGVSGENVARLLEEERLSDGELWIACGTLPEFMDVRGYGK